MAKHVFFVDEVCPDAQENNAGSKARQDTSAILEQLEFCKLEVVYDLIARQAGGIPKRLVAHYTAAGDWSKALSKAQAGDVVIVQFPLLHHSMLAKKPFASARDRGVEIILLVHDLDFIRLGAEEDRSFAAKFRIQAEELSLLTLASIVVVHNESMKRRIVDSCHISPDKIVTLEIFDYLIPDSTIHAHVLGRKAPIIIAGNLRRGKASYIYDLPEDVEFNLYGSGYEDNGQSNIHYKGEFTPEELPSKLEGSFGLIWDGDSALTCSGPFGNYLRINNPHKTSLYLASGLPVVIWDKAALAPFVVENGIGIAISSLHELARCINVHTNEEYAHMKDNVQKISAKIRSGYYTGNAVEQAIACINTKAAN